MKRMTFTSVGSLEPELEISFKDAHLCVGLPVVKEGEVLVYKSSAVKKLPKEVLIEKALDSLTVAEVKRHHALVMTAIKAEP